MIEAKLLNLLKETQMRYARESLLKPNLQNSFEYGKHVGMVQGLETSINLLLQIVNEEKNGA